MSDKPLEQMNEEELRMELARQREANNRPPEPAPVQPGPQQMTEEQWQALEEQTGMTRSQIIATNNIAEFHSGQIKQELAQTKAQLAAKNNVEAALNKAKADDPEFIKYQEHVKSYIDRLPDDKKADPAALAEEMKFAVGYARGMAPRNEKPPEPFGGERFGQTGEINGKAVSSEDQFFGTVHMSKDMTTRIKTDKLVPDEYRDKHRHPEVEGGVSIRQEGEWKAAETAHRARQFKDGFGEPKK